MGIVENKYNYPTAFSFLVEILYSLFAFIYLVF